MYGELVTTTVGLWRVYGPINDQVDIISVCGDIIIFQTDIHGKMIAARVFMSICPVLSSLSLVSILLIIVVEENLKKTMSILAKALAFGSLIAGTIVIVGGMALAMKIVCSKIGNISVSSILGIIAIVFNLADAIQSCR
jgi:hypothetical protein